MPTFHRDATIALGPVLSGFSLNANIGFTSGLEAQGIGLLGQCGFFDRVKVLFDHKARVFQIETP